MDHSSLPLPRSDLKYLSPPFFPAGPTVYSDISIKPIPCAWEMAAPCARHYFWQQRARCSFPNARLRAHSVALQDLSRCFMFAAFPGQLIPSTVSCSKVLSGRMVRVIFWTKSLAPVRLEFVLWSPGAFQLQGSSSFLTII